MKINFKQLKTLKSKIQELFSLKNKTVENKIIKKKEESSLIPVNRVWRRLSIRFVIFVTNYRFFVLTLLEKSFKINKLVFTVFPFVFAFPLIYVGLPELAKKKLPLLSQVMVSDRQREIHKIGKRENTIDADLLMKKIFLIIEQKRTRLTCDAPWQEIIYWYYETEFMNKFYVKSLEDGQCIDQVRHQLLKVYAEYLFPPLGFSLVESEPLKNCSSFTFPPVIQPLDVRKVKGFYVFTPTKPPVNETQWELVWFFPRLFRLTKGEFVTISNKEYLHILEYYLSKYDPSLSRRENMYWSSKDMDYILSYLTANTFFKNVDIKTREAFPGWNYDSYLTDFDKSEKYVLTPFKETKNERKKRINIETFIHKLQIAIEIQKEKLFYDFHDFYDYNGYLKFEDEFLPIFYKQIDSGLDFDIEFVLNKYLECLKEFLNTLVIDNVITFPLNYPRLQTKLSVNEYLDILNYYLTKDNDPLVNIYENMEMFSLNYADLAAALGMTVTIPQSNYLTYLGMRLEEPDCPRDWVPPKIGNDDIYKTVDEETYSDENGLDWESPFIENIVKEEFDLLLTTELYPNWKEKDPNVDIVDINDDLFDNIFLKAFPDNLDAMKPFVDPKDEYPAGNLCFKKNPVLFRTEYPLKYKDNFFLEATNQVKENSLFSLYNSSTCLTDQRVNFIIDWHLDCGCWFNNYAWLIEWYGYFEWANNNEVFNFTEFDFIGPILSPFFRNEFDDYEEFPKDLNWLLETFKNFGFTSPIWEDDNDTEYKWKSADEWEEHWILPSLPSLGYKFKEGSNWAQYFDGVVPWQNFKIGGSEWIKYPTPWHWYNEDLFDYFKGDLATNENFCLDFFFWYDESNDEYEELLSLKAYNEDFFPDTTLDWDEDKRKIVYNVFITDQTNYFINKGDKLRNSFIQPLMSPLFCYPNGISNETKYPFFCIPFLENLKNPSKRAGPSPLFVPLFVQQNFFDLNELPKRLSNTFHVFNSILGNPLIRPFAKRKSFSICKGSKILGSISPDFFVKLDNQIFNCLKSYNFTFTTETSHRFKKRLIENWLIDINADELIDINTDKVYELDLIDFFDHIIIYNDYLDDWETYTFPLDDISLFSDWEADTFPGYDLYFEEFSDSLGALIEKRKVRFLNLRPYFTRKRKQNKTFGLSLSKTYNKNRFWDYFLFLVQKESKKIKYLKTRVWYKKKLLIKMRSSPFSTFFYKLITDRYSNFRNLYSEWYYKEVLDLRQNLTYSSYYYPKFYYPEQTLNQLRSSCWPENSYKNSFKSIIDNDFIFFYKLLESIIDYSLKYKNSVNDRVFKRRVLQEKVEIFDKYLHHLYHIYRNPSLSNLSNQLLYRESVIHNFGFVFLHNSYTKFLAYYPEFSISSILDRGLTKKTLKQIYFNSKNLIDLKMKPDVLKYLPEFHLPPIKHYLKPKTPPSGYLEQKKKHQKERRKLQEKLQDAHFIQKYGNNIKTYDPLTYKKLNDANIYKGGFIFTRDHPYSVPEEVEDDEEEYATVYIQQKADRKYFRNAPFKKDRKPSVLFFNSQVLIFYWLFFIKQIFLFLALFSFSKEIQRRNTKIFKDLAYKVLALFLKKYKQQRTYVVNKKYSISFENLVGVDNILPELYEMVHLIQNPHLNRMSSRKGFLLVGPPGTGKTFLVKAIAGEAKVPVVVESASRVVNAHNIRRREKRLLKPFQLTFQKAKDLAPCILFIDEIDSIGLSRKTLQQKSNSALVNEIHFSSNFPKERDTRHTRDTRDTTDTNNNVEITGKKVKNKKQNENFKDQRKQNLNNLSNDRARSALLHLLVEIDQLAYTTGVFVIGATNRPQFLDPALIRPGRFDTVLNLKLPGKTKRIEILKLYTKNLKRGGLEKSTLDLTNVYWDYLGNTTIGFSAADLATVIKRSAVKAILQNTNHTIETIEDGIDYITTSSREKIKENKYITNFAYYQAGKAVLHTFLPLHSDVSNLRILPSQKNFRDKRNSERINAFESRASLETRLIGLYAGKAAEVLFFSYNYQTKKQDPNTNNIKEKAKNSEPNPQSFSYQTNYISNSISTVGVEDLSVASHIAYLLVNKYHLYSTNTNRRRENQILTNQNSKENKSLTDFSALQDIAKIVKQRVSGIHMSDPFTDNDSFFQITENKDNQVWFSTAFWQNKIKNQIDGFDKISHKWFPIYFARIQEDEGGKGEWVVADKYYHDYSLSHTRNHDIKTIKPKSQSKEKGRTTSLPKVFGKEKETNKTNQSVIWNDLYQLEADYIYYALIYTCFNQAFCLLDENREVLDYLVDYLMRFEILRQDKIEEILFCFGLPTWYKSETESEIKNKQTTYVSQQKENKDQLRDPLLGEKLKNKEEINEVFEKNWGKNSRRPFSRFFTFNQ